MPIFGVCIAFYFLIMFPSCKKDKALNGNALTNEQTIEIALDKFVADLKLNPPDTADISERVKNYMQGKSGLFYGSTVTLLDSTGIAVISPYWFKQKDLFVYANLMDTAYHIDSQLWLRQTIDGRAAIWTKPYFDAGGGNIWMKTRAVPVYIHGKIKAVATTDMSLD